MELLYKEKCDLHAHTDFSDGTKSIEESVESRLPYADIVGISDHFRYIDDELKWEKYISEIRRMKLVYSQKVKSGVEIFYKDLNIKLETIQYKDLDFIIVEDYEYVKVNEISQIMINLRNRYNGDIIMAHPQFIKWENMIGRRELKDLIKFFKKLDIAIEINCNDDYFFGFGAMPEQCFEVDHNLGTEVLQEALISIGTDVHGYEDILFDRFKTTYDYFLKRLI